MVTIAFFLCYKLIDIDDKVERYINAIVIWTLFIFVTTEVLSVFKMITVVNLWLLIIVIKRKDNVFTLLLYLLGAGFILAAVLAPEFLRNIATYSALSSPQTGQRQLIGSLHPRHILVNFVKNFTFNMPTVWIYNSTEILYKCVMKLAGLLEIDINNPGISEDGREFSVPSPQSYGHDSAINPVIVYLLIGCVVLFLIKNRKNIWQK